MLNRCYKPLLKPVVCKVAVAFLFLFLSVCPLIAQQTPQRKLVVEVIDKWTGKAIKSAAVYAEGRGKASVFATALHGNKNFAFNNLPEGYGRIMVEAKGYVAKGYTLTGDEQQITLRLSTLTNVTYDFERSAPTLETMVYIEDPYKLAIRCTSVMNYNDFRRELDSLLYGIEGIELVNPELEGKRFRGEPVKQTEQYPVLEEKNGENIAGDNILPLYKGSNTQDDYLFAFRRKVVMANDIIFYIRHKNGKPFRRYDDPEIEKLRASKGLTVSALVYTKLIFFSRLGEKYTPALAEGWDKRNRFGTADSSKVFFYEGMKYVLEKKFSARAYNKHEKAGKHGIGQTNKYLNYISSYEDVSKLFEICKLTPKQKVLSKPAPGTGLGILDQMEQCASNCTQKKFVMELFD